MRGHLSHRPAHPKIAGADGAPVTVARMNTPDREPDLPEPLAAHLDASAEARATWQALTPADRHHLAQWIHHAWTAHGERQRAEELFAAMSNGVEAFAAWTTDNQWLPASSSGFFGIA